MERISSFQLATAVLWIKFLTLSPPHLKMSWRTRLPCFFCIYWAKNGLTCSKYLFALSARSSTGISSRFWMVGNCWRREAFFILTGSSLTSSLGATYCFLSLWIGLCFMFWVIAGQLVKVNYDSNINTNSITSSWKSV